MAQMSAEDVRSLSDDELSSKLLELKREQFNLRFQQASGQLEKTGRVREVRRDVARVLTMLNQRRAEKAEKAAGAGDTPAPQAQNDAAPQPQDTPAPAAQEPEVSADA